MANSTLKKSVMFPDDTDFSPFDPGSACLVTAVNPSSVRMVVLLVSGKTKMPFRLAAAWCGRTQA